MSDPDIDPNTTGFIIRTDAGARKLVDRMDSMRVQLAALKASTVKWDRLIALLGAAATIIVSASWKVMNDNLNSAERRHAGEVAIIHKRFEEQQRLLNGLFQVNVEKRPPAIVAKEVREAQAADGGVR